MTVAPPSRAVPDEAVLTPAELREHWQDEADAVFVYTALARRSRRSRPRRSGTATTSAR